jgi:hypothetical protein
MDATTSRDNTVTVPTSSASSNVLLTSDVSLDNSMVSKPSQAVMQTLKPLHRRRGESNLTPSITTSLSSSSSDFMTSGSSVHFNLELPREKWLGHKTNTTIATTTSNSNCGTNCSKTGLEDGMKWIDQRLSNNNDSQGEEGKAEKEEHLEQNLLKSADGKQATEFHVPMQDSTSSCCDSALRILSDEPQQGRTMDSYKSELLLDNMQFFNQYKDQAGRLEGDIDENEDLDNLDLEDDLE